MLYRYFVILTNAIKSREAFKTNPPYNQSLKPPNFFQEQEKFHKSRLLEFRPINRIYANKSEAKSEVPPTIEQLQQQEIDALKFMLGRSNRTNTLLNERLTKQNAQITALRQENLEYRKAIATLQCEREKLLQQIELLQGELVDRKDYEFVDLDDDELRLNTP